MIGEGGMKGMRGLYFLLGDVADSLEISLCKYRSREGSLESRNLAERGTRGRYACP
jgi:hypothetical protein